MNRPSILPLIPLLPLALLSTFASAAPILDLGYLMRPDEALHHTSEVPSGREMAEIVRVGARAIHWMDLLQAELPIEKREQIWRRADKIGKEPTPENPLKYNPALIRAAFQGLLAAMPHEAAAVIQGTGELPAKLPPGLVMKEVLAAVRQVTYPYARASRWLGLYSYHHGMPRESMDLRPWLGLRNRQSELFAFADSWDRQTANDRKAWVAHVSEGCAIGNEKAASCVSQGQAVLKQSKPEPVRLWLIQTLALGLEDYNSHFGVQLPHPGVQARQVGDTLEIPFLTYGVPTSVVHWIGAQLAGGWNFPGSVRATISESAHDFSGAVHVEWEDGALPHVNGLGGDTITMDSNTAQWLEQTQVTMTHEFGHVIGFPDCYVEFWDPSEPEGGAFVEYALDPDDRMCALSGGTQERHRVALLAAFGG
jgi:hypothetical protein